MKKINNLLLGAGILFVCLYLLSDLRFDLPTSEPIPIDFSQTFLHYFGRDIFFKTGIVLLLLDLFVSWRLKKAALEKAS